MLDQTLVSDETMLTNEGVPAHIRERITRAEEAAAKADADLAEARHEAAKHQREQKLIRDLQAGADAEGIPVSEYASRLTAPQDAPETAPETAQEAAGPGEAVTPDPEPTIDQEPATAAQRPKKEKKPVKLNLSKLVDRDVLAAGLMLEVLDSEKGLTDRQAQKIFNRLLCEYLGVERLGKDIKQGKHKNWDFVWTKVDLNGAGIKDHDPRFAQKIGQKLTADELFKRTRRRLSQANYAVIRPEEGKKTKRLRLKEGTIVV